MGTFSQIKGKLRHSFRAARAGAGIPDTDFTYSLRWKGYNARAVRFDDATVGRVLGVFKKAGLPPPQDKAEFISGGDGQLVFLGRYGLVLRVEDKKMNPLLPPAPWVLQPLLSVDAGEAVVTLSPACIVGGSESQKDFLKDRLHGQNVNFWDDRPDNIGRIPFRTPHFPDGVPIVIDRGAVDAMTAAVASVKAGLDKIAVKPDAVEREARAAMENLYAPLRRAIDDAWPDKSAAPRAGKMREFLDLCAAYVREGKLVAGWDAPQAHDKWNAPQAHGKTIWAAKVAKAYDRRLSAAMQATPLPAPPFRLP